jgi:hypothetical protein
MPAAACTLQPHRDAHFTADDRRIGGVNQDQFDTRKKALRFEQLPVFCLKQPRGHARRFRAELGCHFLLRGGVQIFCNEELSRFFYHAIVARRAPARTALCWPEFALCRSSGTRPGVMRELSANGSNRRRRPAVIAHKRAT